MEVSSLARTERTLSCLLFPQHTHLHTPLGEWGWGVELLRWALTCLTDVE